MLTTRVRGLADLSDVEPDGLIALIGLVEADEREDKIDVGVGVFRDGEGRTPILQVTKEAEQRLLDTQATKAYLGGRGDKRFAELIGPILLGDLASDPRIDGVQTPGGCGALRLGFSCSPSQSRRASAQRHADLANHAPIVDGVGLRTLDYTYYERGQGVVRFDAMMDAVEQASAGDLILLHGCCHNLTGADLEPDQWAEVTRAVAERGIIPFVDIAYQGLGRGLEEDAAGLRGIVAACEEVIVAQSCDRTSAATATAVGSLWIRAGRRRRPRER